MFIPNFSVIIVRFLPCSCISFKYFIVFWLVSIEKPLFFLQLPSFPSIDVFMLALRSWSGDQGQCNLRHSVNVMIGQAEVWNFKLLHYDSHILCIVSSEHRSVQVKCIVRCKDGAKQHCHF